MAEQSPETTPTSTSVQPLAASTTGVDRPVTSPDSGGSSDSPTAQAPLTQAQAEQILADLKTIKQNLLWVLVIAGFFAARSLIFHY
ncbi:MAG TPA: hypothetical protein IGR64_05880 [Leptolyngbyaceae cyanobacterium M65_K2018_010]|nr:hypothetical protein [Leptolyngbyaceae cyanobacterium M65_K2018_010]